MMEIKRVYEGDSPQLKCGEYLLDANNNTMYVGSGPKADEEKEEEK